MLEPEAVQAALLAAAGEVQALVNHLGVAARSANAAKLVFETDLQASFRRALQYGRTELVSVDTRLSGSGLLAQPCDIVVAARTRTPQLAAEIAWHPRGEDHAGFAQGVIADVVKMALARSAGAVEQAAVLISAPPRFWRWAPGYAQEHSGFELLTPDSDAPASAKSEFLAGPAWDSLFGPDTTSELPERLWTSVLADADVRSPWIESDLRLFEVKGIGKLRSVRPED
ncbi:MAG: hypothetical protein H0W27_02825 [Actinobacteria bacterium]|nr:hypothetical protein [Actinomycetota bacterium]